MKLVLAGNPNSGKTSLFNMLTGSKQHVGNWPGVTVEKKEGIVTIHGEQHTIVDLPGIYTLDADTIEQRVTRDYIFKDKPDLIINILDATNLRRNLYFTLQLREFGIPMVITLNMMDEVEKSGAKIDKDKLSAIFGVPVVGISAAKGKGIDELFNIIDDFKNNKIEIKPFCSGCSNCSKCKSGEYRYHFIDGIIGSCVTEQKHKDTNSTTSKLDKIVLNKYLAFPIFFVIMFIVFSLTFGNIIQKASDGINFLLNSLLSNAIRTSLSSVNSPAPLISLICDGIIPGIGTVIAFLPQIAVLFFLMSALEDSGYMARAAVIMDRIFSYMGLSGSSFIPLIMGFGCTVPAVMACRILPTEKDRRLTVMLTSFVSCSARLPLYALMAGVFFASFQGAVVFSIYLIGIAVAVLAALILKKTVFKNNSTSFVMELPPYRMPNLRSLFMHTWDKVKGFLTKAGTVLFAASVVLWFLQSFTPSITLTNNAEQSIIAYIGRFLSPLFIPLGFGNWKAVTALLSGVAAKEMVVSTFSVLSGSGGNITALHASIAGMFTPLTAYAFMVFVLLYTPCISAIATMRREFNSIKWTFGTIAIDLSAAWIISFLIYSVGRLFGL
jgi:ferrous iron transport protein B